MPIKLGRGTTYYLTVETDRECTLHLQMNTKSSYPVRNDDLCLQDLIERKARRPIENVNVILQKC